MRALRIGLGLIIIASVIGVATYLVINKTDLVRHGETIVPEVFVSDFTFPDRSGNPVNFSEVEARVRIINFWASWSPYSKDELPTLGRLKKEYGRKIEIVAINRDVNPNDGKAFFDSLSLGDDLIEAYDQQDSYYKTIGGYNMPETVFVNPDGGVLAHIHGPMTYNDMQTTLDRLLD